MSHALFLVEGPDDDRFVKDVLEPKMDEHAEVFKYSEKPNDVVDQTIALFASEHDSHYYVTDLDRGTDERGDCSNCDQRERHERRRYDIEPSFSILVAFDAVEGWYLAGVPDEMANEMAVYPPNDTTHVGKDEFVDVFCESEYESQEQLKIDITQKYEYDYDLARQRNDSFAYVADAVGL